MTHDEWLADVRKPGPTGQTFFDMAAEITPHAAASNFIMEDNIDTSLFTPGCGAYAGYSNGTFSNMQSVTAYAANQHAKTFRYTPFVASNADALDIEPGDATPADAPAGYRAGLRYFYGSASWLPLIVGALSGAGIPRSAYRLISAHYIGPHICAPSTCGYASADATQFTDSYLGRSLDATLCPPNFLSAITPVNPWPLVSGASGALVQQLQKALNTWAKLIGLTADLVTDGLFGPTTKAAVILAQEHFKERGITAGYCTQWLFNQLQAAPPAPPAYGPPLALGVSESSVTVTWRPPVAVANVGAVTAYVVTLTDSAKKVVSGFPKILPATQTSLVLLLPRGQEFTFSVAARSATGTGKAAVGPFTA